MMLPIPTQQEVVFHDSTPYKDFLKDISAVIVENAYRGLKGLRGSFGAFETVGMYKMLMVKPEDVVDTLVELKQPVQKWVFKMIEAYEGYQWLFVVIPEGKEISSQPILIEFEQDIRPDDMYCPMMDVHGDEQVSSAVRRNHVLSFGDATFPLTDEDNFKVEVENFPWNDLVFTGTTLGIIENDPYPNGDVWVKYVGFAEETVNQYEMEFYTPYVF